MRRILPITMGGQPYELRTLGLDESDAWLAQVAAKLSEVDLPDAPTGADSITALMTWSSGAVLSLVLAYDLGNALGGEAAIRAAMSKQELKAAMDAMVTAEDPFGEAVAHSVAVGFGAPSRFLASGMRMVLTQMIASQLERSTAGLSGPTASTMAPSEPVGAASSSSSDGRTARHTKRSG